MKLFGFGPSGIEEGAGDALGTRGDLPGVIGDGEAATTVHLEEGLGVQAQCLA